MKMVVLCEESDTVRRCFELLGWDAWSCDIQPSRNPNNKKHLQTDAIQVAYDKSYGWDLFVGHPPCTHLAVSGGQHLKQKQLDGRVYEAIAFAQLMYDCPIRYGVIENPVGVLSTKWRKYDQAIQPWEYGHGETKKTCFWLKNLPPLKPTCIVPGRYPAVWLELPGPNQKRNRSKTYQGVAEAMAIQWTAFYKQQLLLKKQKA